MHTETTLSLGQTVVMLIKLLFFEKLWNYIVSSKGEKQVTLKTIGYEKLRLIVMLSVITNGNKLLPYVILNGMTIQKQFLWWCNWPSSNICMDNSWINERLGCEWDTIETLEYIGWLLKPNSICIWNMGDFWNSDGCILWPFVYQT